MGGGYPFGENNKIYSSVEYARIQPDGSLGPWQMTSSKTKRMYAADVEADGKIYVMGGAKGVGIEDLLNTVERSEIQPDGSLGPWTQENPMNTDRRGLHASYYSGKIFAFVGYNGIFLKDIESVKISPDGALQNWVNEDHDAKTERYIHSGVIYNNYIYLLGGHLMTKEKATDTVEWWREIPARSFSGILFPRSTIGGLDQRSGCDRRDNAITKKAP